MSGSGASITVLASARGGFTSRPGWRWLKRALGVAFLALVAWLLVHQARSIDWAAVWTSIRNQPPRRLLIAGALALSSHLLYSCFDLLGRRHTGHRVPTRMVMLTTFVSYAFNLNLGSLVGGVGFRFRLYSRMGLDAATTSQVLGISMLSNWLGYMMLAGVVFSLHPFALPPDWSIGSAGLRLLGAALLCVALGYVASCAWSPRRDWTLRGHSLRLPSFRFALLQLGMSSLNWSLMGGVVYVLLQQQVGYATVLGVLLVAAFAGIVIRVPAGLGVLEGVFVALLSPVVSKAELLGSLLVYRGMYYIAPLIIATVLYVLLEARTRHAAVVAPRV